MGKFEVERFVTAPDPDLICCVCYCVLDDPLESPCQHVYCKVCISTWLNNRKTCPNCRARLRSSRLKPVLPIVRNMINRLQIRCENTENGCSQSMQLETYNSHTQVCEYKSVRCKNSECNENVLRKDLDSHENQCLHRLTKCDKGCDLLLPLGKLNGHNCLSELKGKLQKVEDNLQTVTLRMTDIEKRVLVLERRKSTRSNRSPTFRASLSLGAGPPIPWYSPSGPNRRRPEENERSRPSNQNNNQRRSSRRRSRSRDRSYSRSPQRTNFNDNSRRRSRSRGRSYSPSPRRTNLNDGRRRRSRSNRSWSLFRDSISRSRSRSPVYDVFGNWSSNNRSGSSTPVSPFSSVSVLALNSDTTVLHSTDDASFNSEINWSLSSDVDVLSDGRVNNIDRGSSTENIVTQTGGEDQQNNDSSPIASINSHRQASTVMNTSNEVSLLTIESENQEVNNNTNVRRSERLATSGDASNNTGTPEERNTQPSILFSAVPILSRSTIEELMNAASETSSSSDESVWEPVNDTTPSDSSIEDEENDLSNSSTNLSSTVHGQGTFWWFGPSFESSDTDDTWSIGGSHRNRSHED